MKNINPIRELKATCIKEYYGIPIGTEIVAKIQRNGYSNQYTVDGRKMRYSNFKKFFRQHEKLKPISVYRADIERKPVRVSETQIKKYANKIETRALLYGVVEKVDEAIYTEETKRGYYDDIDPTTGKLIVRKEEDGEATIYRHADLPICSIGRWLHVSVW